MAAPPAEPPSQGGAGAADPAEPVKKKAKKDKRRDVEQKKEERSIKFRNYVPRTPDLQVLCLSKVTSADVEDEIDGAIADALEKAEDQDAVLAIAPRKPNWDLKRDVERKMQVLQARTDRAVVQLIRQRIKQDKVGPQPEAGASADDEKSHRDEASLALAREVAKAGVPRADSDDEGV